MLTPQFLWPMGTEITQRSGTKGHFKPYALGGMNNHNNIDNPKFWTARLTHGPQRCVLRVFSFPLSRKIDSIQARSLIFKIDIEDDADRTTFLATNVERNVLHVQLEIHARNNGENFEYFARWWAALEVASLRPCWTEPNLVWCTSTWCAEHDQNWRR